VGRTPKRRGGHAIRGGGQNIEWERRSAYRKGGHRRTRLVNRAIQQGETGSQVWPSLAFTDIRLLRGYCARINHPFIPPRPPAWPTLVQYYCTIVTQHKTPFPTSRLYAMHHTILVTTISCNGQLAHLLAFARYCLMSTLICVRTDTILCKHPLNRCTAPPVHCPRYWRYKVFPLLPCIAIQHSILVKAISCKGQRTRFACAPTLACCACVTDR